MLFRSQNVIAAIVQIVACATDGAEGRITCSHPGKGDGFFGFEGSGGSGGFSHCFVSASGRYNAPIIDINQSVLCPKVLFAILLERLFAFAAYDPKRERRQRCSHYDHYEPN